MTTDILETGFDPIMTTDGIEYGCDLRGLESFATDLATALNDAFVTFQLRAELEDAFDTAFLRAAMAETPTLSGAEHLTAA